MNERYDLPKPSQTLPLIAAVPGSGAARRVDVGARFEIPGTRWRTARG